ncbi:helix-turn-helix domain-containing protein [Agrobacterium tumefaciens]|uniref:helix-turn-helix transcriptional regulator n=1 Tax=Agrobacterium tumefaciens TaxID=358 RepID=UPI00122FFEF2|nr:helix-turn-helix domain-containing protein [Agrobacterium tumefaciens]
MHLNGISQNQIAKTLGIGSSSVSRIVTSARAISARTARRLEKAPERLKLPSEQPYRPILYESADRIC